MAKKTNNNLNTSNIIGNDKLEKYLVAYDEENIQKIRDEKKQLVTADEFVGLHQEKLAAERNSEALREHINNTKKVLLDEIDLQEEFFDEVGNPSPEAHRLRAYIEGLTTALATLEDEEAVPKSAKDNTNCKMLEEFSQTSSSLSLRKIYIIPKGIAKILDETDTINDDIPKEVWDWVDETKDDYLDWMGRTFLVLAYCNPLTSPKAFPNIWKVE